jgi:hypothetical protein
MIELRIAMKKNLKRPSMCGVNVNVFLNFYDDNKEKKKRRKKEKVFRVVFFFVL